MSVQGFVQALMRGARGKDAAKALILPYEMVFASIAGGGGGGLPDGYTKLSGIEFSASTYYLITDFRLTGADTVSFSFVASKACNVLGCYTSTTSENNYSLYVSLTNNAKYLRYDGGTYFSQIVADQRYDVVITPTGVTGLERESSWEQKDFTADLDLCIGTTAVSASSSKLDGALYGDIIVSDRLHLVPCMRDSDGVIGYYDLISKTFYEPIGSAPSPIQFSNNVGYALVGQATVV